MLFAGDEYMTEDEPTLRLLAIRQTKSMKNWYAWT